MATNPTVFITGANRGVGLALVREFLGRGFTVAAACREPGRADDLQALAAEHGDRLHVPACDVTSDDSVRRCAHCLAGVLDSLDILVNNAGIFLRGDDSMETADIDTIRRTFDTNVLGPLRVVRALLPLVRRGRMKRIAHISSKMGSVSLNSGGGSYSYRLSKAALNMLSRNLAVELAGEGIVSLALHPGWAQTAMGGPRATVPVDDAARGIAETILRAGPEQSGGLMEYTGRELSY